MNKILAMLLISVLVGCGRGPVEPTKPPQPECTSPVLAVAISGKEALACTAHLDGTVRLVDVASQRLVWSVQLPAKPPQEANKDQHPFARCVFVDDRGTVAVVHSNEPDVIITISEGAIKRRIRAGISLERTARHLKAVEEQLDIDQIATEAGVTRQEVVDLMNETNILAKPASKREERLSIVLERASEKKLNELLRADPEMGRDMALREDEEFPIRPKIVSLVPVNVNGTTAVAANVDEIWVLAFAVDDGRVVAGMAIPRIDKALGIGWIPGPPRSPIKGFWLGAHDQGQWMLWGFGTKWYGRPQTDWLLCSGGQDSVIKYETKGAIAAAGTDHAFAFVTAGGLLTVGRCVEGKFVPGSTHNLGPLPEDGTMLSIEAGRVVVGAGKRFWLVRGEKLTGPVSTDSEVAALCIKNNTVAIGTADGSLQLRHVDSIPK